MVGIVLASHGEFANGILQSGAMIFGEQKNVKAITLAPSEGPESLKAKMEAAVSTFEDQENVLFLVDLWGGTPFNQSNMLIEGHEDRWAIVTGLNLPMLIEAYASRMSMNSAHEIATHVAKVAKEGVKTKPESLEPKEEKAKGANANTRFTGGIPEGTVLGAGKIKYVLARIDTRLLHGQVATTWTKTTQPDRIIVVSDAVAKDTLRKNMMEEAAPPGVKANVIPIDKMIQVAKDPRFGATKAMLLFETPQDALQAIEGGVEIKELNLGSIAHSLGKVVVNKAIAMDGEDVKAIEALMNKGIKFDVRKVPAGVVAVANKYHKPCICISGALGLQYKKLYQLGFIGIYSVADRAMSFSQALEGAKEKLEAATYSIVKTIMYFINKEDL
ncbi:MAG: PTS mannose transporter subunit IIAB [Clostridia bacterium]|nr:PTS mannose transporter subunit IIAB [Erysipelotrichia bacterium]NCC88268.1 PTS mannose transporter subunit IIAB [Clostridia bacterium]